MPREFSISELEDFPCALTGRTLRRELQPAFRASLEKILETQNGNGVSLEEAYALAQRRRRRPARPAGCRQSAARANSPATSSPTWSIATSISPTFVLWDASSAPSAAARAKSDTYFLTLEQVAQKAVEAWATRRNRSLHSRRTAARPASVLLSRHSARGEERRPAMHIHAFSPMEIVYGVELTGMPLADYLSHAARQRPRHAARHRRRNSRRRDPQHSLAQ